MDYGTGMTHERQKERLLFTIAKILRKRLGTSNEDYEALTKAIGDFRNYIPYQQAPGD